MKKTVLTMTCLVLLLGAASGHNDTLLKLTSPLPVVEGLETEDNEIVDLSNYFTDPDYPDEFTFELLFNSHPNVAQVVVNDQHMVVDFLSPGQTNIYLKANNAGKDMVAKTVVGVLPSISGNYLVSDFEDVAIGPESFWNGSDNSGYLNSGSVSFSNNYNPEYFSWYGWACSNISDNITPGFMNQYSAITGQGFESSKSSGSNYGVAYVYDLPNLSFSDTTPHQLAGLLITNNTYTALSMENGDDYSKKFGGESGKDPDFFKVMIWGYEDGVSTDSIEYFLADYRFENDTMDYLIKTWQWVDLSSLGKVDSLFFSLTSSDMGDWGMNTPGFFCIDNLTVVPNTAPVGTAPTVNKYDVDLHIYPNPGAGRFFVGTNYHEQMKIEVFNVTGSLIYQDRSHFSHEVVDISEHPAGPYLIRATNGKSIIHKMIQKQ